MGSSISLLTLFVMGVNVQRVHFVSHPLGRGQLQPEAILCGRVHDHDEGYSSGGGLLDSHPSYALPECFFFIFLSAGGVAHSPLLFV